MKKRLMKFTTGLLSAGILAGAVMLGSVDLNVSNLHVQSVLTVEAKTSNYYIFPDSDSRYLTKDEIYELSSYEMKLARNEIYARHGRRFKTKKIQAYFDNQDWYEGTISASKFDEDVFNKYERSNISLIRKCEKGSGSSSSKTLNYYILPDSDSSYLGYNDIKNLSSYDLRLARNEIYARHGRKFKTKKIQAYFDSQKWYSGTVSASKFDEDVLNKYERSNIKLIKEYEKGGSGKSDKSAKSNYYILPNSDSSYLLYADIKNLSSYELKLARNEIYARHGRRFKNKKIQAYFDNQQWYSGTVSADKFKESVLNKYESSNVEFIQSYE